MKAKQKKIMKIKSQSFSLFSHIFNLLAIPNLNVVAQLWLSKLNTFDTYAEFVTCVKLTKHSFSLSFSFSFGSVPLIEESVCTVKCIRYW